MYYCINHIINTDRLYFNNSILIKYEDSNFTVISTFENNSTDLLLLFEYFDRWLTTYINQYDFNTNNFMFVSYDNIYFSEDLSYILKLYYKTVEPNRIYYYNYSIAMLFKNVYGFTFKSSTKVMKRFLNIPSDISYVKNIDCNILLCIFIKCLIDYGQRINNYKPNELIID